MARVVVAIVTAADGLPHSKKSGKQLTKDVVDGLGIGLAAGGFHDLADEKLENAFVTSFEFGNVVRIFGDDVASGFDDGGFADLGTEAFGGDDLCSGAAGVEHGCEDLFGDPGSNLLRLDHFYEFRQRFGRWTVLKRLLSIVQ